MLHVVVRPKDGSEMVVDHPAGTLTLGRVVVGGPRSSDPCRIEWNDPFVSGKHVELSAGWGNILKFRNVSARNPARLENGTIIPPNSERDIPMGPSLPLVFMIGETHVQVHLVDDPLASVPMASLAGSDASLRLEDVEGSTDQAAERLAGWLNTVVDLQRSAASSKAFFQQTSKALVNLIGLDRGLVLLKRKNRWMVEARHPEGDHDGPGREFSTSVLAKVEEDRKTYFSDGANLGSSESLAAVKAVVASPILDHKGEVKGAVYGIRDKASRSKLGQITIGNLEAQMVRLLASTVAVGMARLETAANFEAFFGSELALELENNPALLTGREREISVLFADIRGFSRFSQALGPSETCKLVGEVMEKLSQCVRDQKGVIVSYMGDGILAMWNAPQEQPDHAMRAVRAGQAMINCLGETNQTWSGRTGGLKVGVGISSGPASCGNTGSSFKFQYGPLGNTVNVASRVEGATKHFGVSMLVTASTRALLDEKVPVRRVRKVMLKGIPEAVDLYEVPESSGGAELGDFIKRYELSLKHYEEGRHLEAVKGLQNLLANAAEPDGPTLALLMRAVAALGQIEQGSPVEEMQGK